MNMTSPYNVKFDSFWRDIDPVWTAKVNGVEFGEFEYLGYHSALEVLVEALNEDDTNITLFLDSEGLYSINNFTLPFIPSIDPILTLLDKMKLNYTTII